jgi:YesN/AraC family two-component response regulator
VIERGEGRTDIALYHQQRADLVITDIHLPESYGPEAIMI